ncbi:DUF177 domain-containing protein [Bacteroidota bacterium]
MLDTYKISFINLEEGNHIFKFKVEKEFFEQFDFHNIKGGNLNILVNLEKQEKLLILDFSIKGFVNSVCDICLDSFDLQVEISDRLYVKFNEIALEQIDENIIIGLDEKEINIAHNIFEIIELNLPHKRIHPINEQDENQCNVTMLNKINEHIMKKETEQKTDPRWEKLKKINLQ